MQPQEIKELIETGLTDAKAYVDGDGAHFTAAVVCPHFADKSRIEKQKLVMATVKSQLMDGTLHALSIKTFTPQEYKEWCEINGK